MCGVVMGAVGNFIPLGGRWVDGKTHPVRHYTAFSLGERKVVDSTGGWMNSVVGAAIVALLYLFEMREIWVITFVCRSWRCIQSWNDISTIFNVP